MSLRVFGLQESIMAYKLDAAVEKKMLLLLEPKGGRYPGPSRAAAGQNATPEVRGSSVPDC